MSEEEKRWTVVRVKRDQERSLADDVEAMGVEVCCPTKTSNGPRRRGEEGRMAVIRAALPNYLIMGMEAFEDPDNRDELCRDHRCYGFLKIGEHIAAVRDRIVTEFRNRRLWDHDEFEFYSGPLYCPIYYHGDIVTVHGGPAQGLDATVVERNKSRYKIDIHKSTLSLELGGLQLVPKSV
ncbi:MAG: transcription termination/antitermination protein NusG [Geminicoccaceae bacterium]